MKIEQVEIFNDASIIKGDSNNSVVHKNCRFSLADNQALLTGPKHAHIATGHVNTIETGYDGSEYQLRLAVFVPNKEMLYQYQIWYITF